MLTSGGAARAEEVESAAHGVFGSGWVWLSWGSKQGSSDGGGKKLQLEISQGAGNPLTHGRSPVMALDLWEHAFCVDHPYRLDYVRVFLDKLVDWVSFLRTQCTQLQES